MDVEKADPTSTLRRSRATGQFESSRILQKLGKPATVGPERPYCVVLGEPSALRKVCNINGHPLNRGRQDHQEPGDGVTTTFET